MNKKAVLNSGNVEWFVDDVLLVGSYFLIYLLYKFAFGNLYPSMTWSTILCSTQKYE